MNVNENDYHLHLDYLTDKKSHQVINGFFFLLCLISKR